MSMSITSNYGNYGYYNNSVNNTQPVKEKKEEEQNTIGKVNEQAAIYEKSLMIAVIRLLMKLPRNPLQTEQLLFSR